MPSRIPIPPRLGGGWVDDPGPLDAAERKRRGQHIGMLRYRQAMGFDASARTKPAPGFADPWEPHEIEECARFARLSRDD